MMRERTFPNLAIGFILSVLLHTYLVIWGPSFSLPVPTLHQPTEIEVDVREWPAPPVVPPQEEPTPSAEPPPPPPRQAQPAVPPDTVVLQQAERAAIMPIQPDQAEVRLPEQPPPLPPSAPADPVRVAQSLLESLRTDPPPLPSSRPPTLPDPERRLAERRELPPLPALERAPRHTSAPARPVTMPLPSPDPIRHIKGPAAERQVIFQPPPPTPTVEGETEIELRFWILPNGTVSRVVPLKKSDPRLEALATNYLRHWRFNALPPGVEQDEQWGIIPFKFRIR